MTAKSEVPSKDYARQYRAIWPEIQAAIERALFHDDPILGDAVAQFEANLARYHGTATAVGVASGMAALELTLRELGIGPGDEVITGAHTFVGTVTAIVLSGATPVLVDADATTGLIDPEGVSRAITPRTRAILPVHFYGHPVDLTRLGEIAAAARVHLIEDGAQAHGAKWRGQPIGGFGVACALSFHPSKNLGAFGDGGAILTNDLALAERLRVTRNLGKSSKYEFSRVAGNNKLDTIQAAILDVKLRHLEGWIERRRQLATLYRAGLAGVGDLVLPYDHREARHAFHLYVVRTARRQELQRHLAAHGIRAGLHYPIAAHRHGAHAQRFAGQSFPVAERLADEVLTLPLSHEHEDVEIARVIDVVRGFYSAAAATATPAAQPGAEVERAS
jgi:dTDP-3-amino-3,4,6-trideoxy-alpha-D-glucose transaminase